MFIDHKYFKFTNDEFALSNCNHVSTNSGPSTPCKCMQTHCLQGVHHHHKHADAIHNMWQQQVPISTPTYLTEARHTSNDVVVTCTRYLGPQISAGTWNYLTSAQCTPLQVQITAHREWDENYSYCTARQVGYRCNICTPCNDEAQSYLPSLPPLPPLPPICCFLFGFSGLLSPTISSRLPACSANSFGAWCAWPNWPTPKCKGLVTSSRLGDLGCGSSRVFLEQSWLTWVWDSSSVDCGDDPGEGVGSGVAQVGERDLWQLLGVLNTVSWELGLLHWVGVRGWSDLLLLLSTRVDAPLPWWGCNPSQHLMTFEAASSSVKFPLSTVRAYHG